MFYSCINYTTQVQKATVKTVKGTEEARMGTWSVDYPVLTSLTELVFIYLTSCKVCVIPSQLNLPGEERSILICW